MVGGGDTLKQMVDGYLVCMWARWHPVYDGFVLRWLSFFVALWL